MARNGARPLSRPLSRLNFVQPLQFGFKLPEPEPHDSIAGIDPAAVRAALHAADRDGVAQACPAPWHPVEYATNLPTTVKERVRAAPQLATYAYAGPYYTFLGFNLRARGDTTLPHPLFGDRDLRRALTIATDRQQMAQSVFAGLAKVPPGPMPLLWATWDSTLRALPYDSSLAGRLLSMHGWRDHDGDGVRDRDSLPLKFELLTPTSSAMRRQYARRDEQRKIKREDRQGNRHRGNDLSTRQR